MFLTGTAKTRSTLGLCHCLCLATRKKTSIPIWGRISALRAWRTSGATTRYLTKPDSISRQGWAYWSDYCTFLLLNERCKSTSMKWELETHGSVMWLISPKPLSQVSGSLFAPWKNPVRVNSTILVARSRIMFEESYLVTEETRLRATWENSTSEMLWYCF